MFSPQFCFETLNPMLRFKRNLNNHMTHKYLIINKMKKKQKTKKQKI